MEAKPADRLGIELFGEAPSIIRLTAGVDGDVDEVSLAALADTGRATTAKNASQDRRIHRVQQSLRRQADAGA